MHFLVLLRYTDTNVFMILSQRLCIGVSNSAAIPIPFFSSHSPPPSLARRLTIFPLYPQHYPPFPITTSRPLTTPLPHHHLYLPPLYHPHQPAASTILA